MIGDASAYGNLLQLVQNEITLPPHPEDLLVAPREGGSAPLLGVDNLPDTAQICSCNNVSKADLCNAISDGVTDLGELKSCTKAGTGCGGCVPLVKDILTTELKKAGVEVKNHVCEHFEYSRQELFHLVKVNKIHTFADLLSQHGKGMGCEICKPTVASILASTWNEHVLETPHVGLQDTNDYYLANIQKDGTYSVIPRVPGGEITPEKLITIGEVAKNLDFILRSLAHNG